MKKSQYTRRAFNTGAVASVAAMATAGGPATVFAAQKVVKIGITTPLTGADAEDATRIKDGAMLAFDEANAMGGVAGYKIEVLVYDNGTATAGQYDPAQAATNTKKLVADPQVIANVGPEMSGDGKAMSPILSEADMATITPASTNPDITSPKFAHQFRPKGKAVYFRTVTTDAYQGPNMANYYKEKLHTKSVYILDDSGAYGVGMANAFEAQAKKIGIKVLGHDQLDPKEADYTTVLTKIKALNPDAIYYGGVAQAGVKLAKQAYETVPKMIKGGGDGIQGGSFLKGGGFPAIEGWYCTIAGPHLTDSPEAAKFMKDYKAKFHDVASDYSITSYDAAKVIIAAIEAVAKSGKAMNRSNIRDAIQASHVKTLQGTVSFDQNGDILDHTVSVFQYHHDPSAAADDLNKQQKYLGAAPQTA
jgi:branched-chain amino acid transport system substrate-binding protein